MSNPDNPQDSTYSWFRLAVTLAIGMVANVGMWAVIVVMPGIETEFGAGRADASLPYTLTMIGFALGNLIIGRIVDRYGVTIALNGAVVVIVAGYGLATIAGSIQTLSAAQLLVGLGTGVGFGPLMADISHWFTRRRGIAVALVASGNYLSGALWPTLLADVLAQSGWRAVYLLLAGATVLVVVPLSFLLRRRAQLDTASGVTAQSALRRGDVGLSPRMLQFLLGLAGIACCVAMSMPQVHIVAYCVGLGYGPAVGAQMLSIMLLGGVVSRIVSGLVADRLGGVLTLLIGSVLQMIALVFYLPWDGMVPLYIISLFFGLAQGGIVPSYALIVREYMPAREAGARVGFVMMMTILGMALGGWMSGWIYDVTRSYEWAFINGIAFNALNVLIAGALLWRASRRMAAVA